MAKNVVRLCKQV